MSLFIWILVSFGITFTITHSKLLKSLRERAAEHNPLLGELLCCPMCLGFWVGSLLSLCWESVTGNFILDGFLSLSSCWLLYATSWALALHDDRVQSAPIATVSNSWNHESFCIHYFSPLVVRSILRSQIIAFFTFRDLKSRFAR